MKKFRNLFMVLALALVLVFAAKGLGANAETVVDPVTFSTSGGSGSSVSGTPTFNTNEATLTVNVTGGDKLYYQVVKDANAITKIKASNWIPAVKVSEGTYKIDLSAYTKSVVVAYTFDATKEKAADGNVAVGIPDNKLKVKVNFGTSVVVDPNALGYGASATSGCRLADIVAIEGGATTLTYQYRRSTGEAWKNDEDANKGDLYQTYSMLRASNGTLYVRAYTTATPGLATKEVKVKVPKGASAPKIKVDYNKGVVKFPKACEVVASVSGGDNSKYYYVTANGISNTKSDAKADIEVGKLVENMTPDSNNKVNFTVRTAATEKKFASFFTTVEFVVPAAAPSVTAVYDATQKAIIVSVSGGATGATYQYEKSAGKWADIKDGKIKATAKPTDKLKVRVAPVKETKDKVGVFGSEYASVTVGDATVKVTFTLPSGITVKDLEGNIADAVKGSDYSFTLQGELDTGKEFKVMVGSDVVKGTSNTYKIEKVTEAVTVTVTIVDKPSSTSGQ